jgi:surfeit locus 1 family protein
MRRSFLRPRSILTTLLVIAALAVLVRLGIWQLDRLQERRIFNGRVNSQINLPVLDLTKNSEILGLFDMEYRTVDVVGVYDSSQQVMLRNQVWQDQPGVHLLTPLKIKDSDRAVLIDRGWVPVPYADAQIGNLSQYNESGEVTVHGVIRRPESRPYFGGVPDPILAPGQTRLEAWNLVNLDRIKLQISFSMLPVYIQQAPDPTWTQMPYRSQPVLDLSEGPHFGYALQWFTFALILAVGYPFFVRRQFANQTRLPLGIKMEGIKTSASSNGKNKAINSKQSVEE